MEILSMCVIWSWVVIEIVSLSFFGVMSLLLIINMLIGDVFDRRRINLRSDNEDES